MKLYHVYILMSRSRVTYIGVTGHLEKRLIQHRWSRDPHHFTARYRVFRLVYFEEYTRVEQAIAREKQLKGWSREKKLALISTMNPEFNDLAPDLYPDRMTHIAP
jgi:putative endonuclease